MDEVTLELLRNGYQRATEDFRLARSQEQLDAAFERIRLYRSWIREVEASPFAFRRTLENGQEMETTMNETEMEGMADTLHELAEEVHRVSQKNAQLWSALENAKAILHLLSEGHESGDRRALAAKEGLESLARVWVDPS